MSYINDALKKGQKEKDSLYQRYGNIISDPVYHRTGRGKSWMITASVIVLILLALSVFMLLRYYASSGTGNSDMDVIQEAGDKTEVGGRRSEVGGRRAEIRSQRSEVGNRRAEKEKDEHRTSNSILRRSGCEGRVEHRTSNEKQKKQGSEVGSQKSEVGGQKAEIRSQGSGVRDRGQKDVKRLYSKALNYQQNGNPAMAEKVYRKILVRDPGFVTGLNNLGVICMGKKRNKEAADLFIKAIDLKVDYVDPYYNLACLYSMSGNISKSLYYLKMAVSINNSVKNWAKNDKDLENVRESAEFKRSFGRKKNLQN